MTRLIRYGIEFLNKNWDKNTGAVEVWSECWRVLKPGGYLLAFSAPRTYHRLATNLEDIGFQIKDQIMWIFATGYAHGYDVGKNGLGEEWEGWKTALKKAHEPIVLAIKPTELSIVKNIMEYGCGALNIDGCRIPYEDEDKPPISPGNGLSRMTYGETEPEKWKNQKNKPKPQKQGSDPLNRLNHDIKIDDERNNMYIPSELGRYPTNVIGDIEGYSRYFYSPKVRTKERNVGMNDITKNTHPTPKPVALMAYLCRLVTPPNGKVLDPFCGSGSTGMAAVEEGFEFVGIDLDERYCEIANKRIEAWNKDKMIFDEIFETAKDKE